MWYRQTLLHHPSLFKYIPRALSVTAPLSSASDYARELYCICTLRTVRTGFFGYTHQFRIGMAKSEVGLTTFGDYKHLNGTHELQWRTSVTVLLNLISWCWLLTINFVKSIKVLLFVGVIYRHNWLLNVSNFGYRYWFRIEFADDQSVKRKIMCTYLIIGVTQFYVNFIQCTQIYGINWF